MVGRFPAAFCKIGKGPCFLPPPQLTVNFGAKAFPGSLPAFSSPFAATGLATAATTFSISSSRRAASKRLFSKRNVSDGRVRHPGDHDLWLGKVTPLPFKLQRCAPPHCRLHPAASDDEKSHLCEAPDVRCPLERFRHGPAPGVSHVVERLMLQARHVEPHFRPLPCASHQPNEFVPGVIAARDDAYATFAHRSRRSHLRLSE